MYLLEKESVRFSPPRYDLLSEIVQNRGSKKEKTSSISHDTR